MVFVQLEHNNGKIRQMKVSFLINTLFSIKVVGRWKSSTANLKLIPGFGRIQINGCTRKNYFSNQKYSFKDISKPVQVITKNGNRHHIQIFYTFDYKVTIKGGGLKSQVDTLKLVFARAFYLLFKITQQNYRPFLRKHILLTCNSRVKERRKYGLKKARKASQFSKR